MHTFLKQLTALRIILFYFLFKVVTNAVDVPRLKYINVLISLTLITCYGQEHIWHYMAIEIKVFVCIYDLQTHNYPNSIVIIKFTVNTLPQATFTPPYLNPFADCLLDIVGSKLCYYMKLQSTILRINYICGWVYNTYYWNNRKYPFRRNSCNLLESVPRH